jgi:hypothetical protein
LALGPNLDDASARRTLRPLPERIVSELEHRAAVTASDDDCHDLAD